MATITITVPDEQTTRIKNAFVGRFRYEETIDGEPNPVTPNQFVSKMVKEYIKQTVREWEQEQAAIDSAQTIRDEIEGSFGG